MSNMMYGVVEAITAKKSPKKGTEFNELTVATDTGFTETIADFLKLPLVKGDKILVRIDSNGYKTIAKRNSSDKEVMEMKKELQGLGLL